MATTLFNHFSFTARRPVVLPVVPFGLLPSLRPSPTLRPSDVGCPGVRVLGGLRGRRRRRVDTTGVVIYLKGFFAVFLHPPAR